MYTNNVFMPEHPLFWITGKVRLATVSIQYAMGTTVQDLGFASYTKLTVTANPNLGLLAAAYKHRGEIFDPSMADVISLRRQAEFDNFPEIWKFHLVTNTPANVH